MKTINKKIILGLTLVSMVFKLHAASPVTAPSGMVAWWKGDDDAIDSIGGNNGTLLGELGFATGKVCDGFNFDGVDDTVSIPASGSLNVGTNDGFTLECWIKPNDVSDQHPMFEWRGGSGTSVGVHFWTGTGGAGVLYANIVSPTDVSHTITSPSVIVTNVFQHVALTFDKASGIATLFYNGVPVQTASFGTGFTPKTDTDLLLGRRIDGGSLYFWGIMDEPSVYNRALSTNEIMEIYTASSAGKLAGMVSWWKGESNTVDHYGSNNGTASGGLGYTAGEVGTGFNFDGVNDTISIPASASLNVGTNQGFTLECWIKPHNISNQHPLFEWMGETNDLDDIGVHFWAPSSETDSLYANIVDTDSEAHGIVVSDVLQNEVFQHVAVTFDRASGMANLYRNGSLVQTANLGSDFTPKTINALLLGRRMSSDDWYFYGVMDEPSIYNRALTPCEVFSIYNAGSAGKTLLLP